MGSRDEIERIKEFLKNHPRGMSIGGIATALSLNRATAARYLDMLWFSGLAEMRQFGQAKVFSPARRLPMGSVLNLFASPILIIDQDFFIRDANDALLKTFELKRGDVVGHNMLYTSLAASFSGTFEETVRLVIEGRRHSAEKTYERNGKKYTFCVRMEPVVDEDGQTCAAVILENITELRHYQQQLEAMVEQRTKELNETNTLLKKEIEQHLRTKDAILISRQMYRALVEDMPAFVCNYEPDGTITFVNENFCEAAGRDRDELVGVTIYSLLSEKNQELVKKKIAAISPALPAVTATLAVATRDREICYEQWTIRALYDRRGKIAGYQSIGIDITDRIRSEAKLAEEEKKLDAIIRGSPQPQLVIGKDHRIIIWNKAMELFSGLPAAKMIGSTTFGNLFYDRERPLLADLILEGKAEEIARLFPENCKKSRFLRDTWEGITFSNIRRGGEGGWVFFTAAAIRDEKGGIICVVETMEDLVGYQTKDGTSFMIRSLYPLLHWNAVS